MNIIFWWQSQPNFNILQLALQILNQRYDATNILGAVYSSTSERGGVALNGNPIIALDKNSLPNIDFDIVLVSEQDNSFGYVLEEARRLNLDTSKFVLDRTICTYGFAFELYQKISRSGLSIISQNSFGALTGYTFGLPNSSVNFSFTEKDFLKFLRAPFRYINSELRLAEITPRIKFFLGDVELIANYLDEKSARAAWKNWLANFNPFNTLVVMYTEKPDVLAEFDKFPYAKKICFVPFETKLDSGFYIKPYYVGGRSFEAAVNKIALHNFVCFNVWDILFSAKKTPVNLYSKAVGNQIRPGKIFSSPNGKLHFYNWVSEVEDINFLSNFVENNVGNEKVFNFFYPYGDHRLVRVMNAEHKIFITREEVFTWEWYDGYQDYCLDFVDLALGYEYFDNSNYMRFPYWLFTTFEPKVDMNVIKSKIDEINSARSTGQYEGVLINSHDMMNTRTPIYEKLKTVLQIKCAGTWNRNTDELQTIYSDDKRKYVHEFKFNICPENVNRFGYVTEKIFDSFIAGAIPIYYGSDNNPEEGIINKDAVLFWNPNSDNEALVKEVVRLKNDSNYYEKFMRQEKLFAKNAAEYVYNKFAEFARRLKEM